MLKSLYSGVSGLKTHQQKMDVIGNNIANVNTTGYKTNVVTFADIYYQTKRSPSAATSSLGGVNPRQVGYGVKMNTTTANMTQSGFTSSDSKYDMAIDGEGFFQVMDGSGNIYYTRAGIFNVDESGYLVDANGYHVLGVSGDSEGQAAGSEIIRFVIADTEAKCSSATKTVNGVGVTLSVSAPSDNTDMSVSFVNGEYPFATYANGILSLTINMDTQYESEVDFQNAINDALNAGGITLPDDVELLFSFDNIPNNPESVAATNTVEWTYSTTSSTADVYVPYTYTDSSGNTSDKSAQIAFSTPDVPSTTEVAISYADANTTGATYSNGVWTITIGATTTSNEINRAITAAIEEAKAADADAEVPGLTCTTFVLPSSDNGNRTAAFTKINEALGGGNMKLVGVKDSPVDVTFDVTESGAYANNYKITFAYSSTYGDGTKAVWDENNLTITINNSTTLQDIQDAIDEAANGNDKKKLIISGLDQLEDMNAAQRKALFEGNPALSLGGGADSFFTEVLNSLSTFNLTDGRVGSPQSYADLSDITIQTDGTIIGIHAVHGYITLGRIDLATFDNPNGLSAIGGTMFAETVASGAAKVNIAGSSGTGEILSGSLEMSNVDLSQEFTDMITTQRGFQANSRTITVSDTLLEELLALKRS